MERRELTAEVSHLMKFERSINRTLSPSNHQVHVGTIVVGKDKMLLIDLSNFIKWDTSAVSSLRSIVYSYKGNRELYISFTHNHRRSYRYAPGFQR